jgi:hypothetical protein
MQQMLGMFASASVQRNASLIARMRRGEHVDAAMQPSEWYRIQNGGKRQHDQ